MKTLLGVAALTVALATIVVPVATLYLIWLALVLATAAAFSGRWIFSLAATLICLANLALLNPFLWAAIVWQPPDRSVLLQTATSVLFLSPVAATILSFGNKGERRPEEQ